MTDFINDIGNDIDNDPVPCWTKHDLIREVVASATTGAILGSLGEGVGALPGAGIGAAVGAMSWFGENLGREQSGLCPSDTKTKTLPQVDIDHSNQK